VNDAATLGAGWDVARINDTIRYHSEAQRVLTTMRTALESELIPVTAYVVLACCEAWRRWPGMVRRIAAAASPEALGVLGHAPGRQINSVYHWAIPNFLLIGRQALAMFSGMGVGDVRWDSGLEDMAAVLDFWERSVRAYRRDGSLMAHDTGNTATPYGAEVLEELRAGLEKLDAEGRTATRKALAHLQSHLFLLYLDTRVGVGDTGPYPLPDGRVLLVRDLYRLGRSDFPWSDVAAEMPYRHLCCALEIEPGFTLRVIDCGSTFSEPADYWPGVRRVGLYTTDGGPLRRLSLADLPAVAEIARRVQKAHYRQVAGWSTEVKIYNGAYVYFSFLRPFAEAAGVADELDWSVGSHDLYPFIKDLRGDGSARDPAVPFYEPVP